MKKESNPKPPKGVKPTPPPAPPTLGCQHFCHALHTHPLMERKLGVPEGHVIIDSDVFMALRKIHGMKVEC